MHFDLSLSTVLCIILPISSSGEKIPDDFPRFKVPGHGEAMETLRELYYLHYKPAGPLSTIWDEWLSGPSLSCNRESV